MNILVATLGFSWHIIPELLGFTNPGKFPLYEFHPQVAETRKKFDVQPIDECWIVTGGLSERLASELASLKQWANHFSFMLRFVICKDLVDFTDEQAIRTMRSCIYRVVLHASENLQGGALYLSLAGGRKTMSADMQEAANLFGCKLLLHVIDTTVVPEDVNSGIVTTWIQDYQRFGNYFLPLVIKTAIRRNVLLDSGRFKIQGTRYPLFCGIDQEFAEHTEDMSLLEEIEQRKTDSDQIYRNFLASLDAPLSRKRNSFRALQMLDAEIIRVLKSRRIGFQEKEDIKLLQRFPKCELHSHLGGVLYPREILKVASQEKSLVEVLLLDADHSTWFKHVCDAVSQSDLQGLYELKQTIRKRSTKESFERNLVFLAAFQDNPDLFEKLVYYPAEAIQEIRGIGIEAYQQFGDFQGSLLLQTKALLEATCRIYADNLYADGVEYVEIRCSPYKYCEYGLSLNEVLDCIMKSMDESKVTYRLIIIMGRTSTKQEISERVEELLHMYRNNKKFATKFVGVDLAGTEGAQKPSELRECFLPLLRECIHITIHAGETESVDNIWEAVYYLAADRIGHGLQLLDKPELMERFLDKHIGVELCPSSNDQIIGYGQGYPLVSYMEQGLKVTLNTDNCGISGTSMSREFFKAGSLCGGLSLWDCLVLIRNSISIAFLDTDTKRWLMAEYEKKILDHIQKGVFL